MTPAMRRSRARGVRRGRLTAPGLLIALALATVGCTGELTPISLIDRTRILTATVTAEDALDPAETYPAPGERATVRFEVDGFDPEDGLTWIVFACRAAIQREGVPLCTLGGTGPEGELIPTPTFPGTGSDAFLQGFRQVDARSPTGPVIELTLADEITPTGQQSCPDVRAPDGAGFDVAEVLLTGAICGPGSVPVEPAFVPAFRGLLDGSVAPDEVPFTDPNAFVTRCVDAETGEATEEARLEEEAFSFSVPIRLPAPAPSSQGNRPPFFSDAPQGERKPFSIGQGVDCFPGFDNENAPSLESELALWPETEASSCADPAFPDLVRISNLDDVCIGVRAPAPIDGAEASEVFDPDGEGLCRNADAADDDGPPGDDGGSRDRDDVAGDRIPTRETLVLAQFADAGELERPFSVFEVEEDDDGQPILDGAFQRNPAFFEWEPPQRKDLEELGEIPPEGLLVRFVFVLRDGRGGSALARRQLCLEPPPEGS